MRPGAAHSRVSVGAARVAVAAIAAIALTSSDAVAVGMAQSANPAGVPRGRGSDAAAIAATEAAIKAAYLYKFGFFVEWPSTALPTTDTPINLCVVGPDPFGTTLDETVKGQKIGDHPVTIRRLNTVSRESGCHIVYLAVVATPGAGQMLAALHGSNVLTVTDAPPGSAAAGIINFVIKDNRVRFDIDDAAAAAGGLTISSRLLNLAINVKPRH